MSIAALEKIQSQVKSLKADELKLALQQLTGHKQVILSKINQKIKSKTFRLGQVVTGLKNDDQKIQGIIVGFEDFQELDEFDKSPFYSEADYLWILQNGGEWKIPAIVLFDENQELRWWQPWFILEVREIFNQSSSVIQK